MAPEAFAGTAADSAHEVDLLRVLDLPEREPVDVAGNRPLLLDDLDAVWLLAGGKVDLFAVELGPGNLDGARRHLRRLERGDALLGVDLGPAASALRLEARGTPGTRVL